jgi:hypothetical protein
MSAASLNAILGPTLEADLNATSPLTILAHVDSSSVQAIIFGVLSTLLGVGAIVLAYLQLVRMRMAQPQDAERDYEIS